MSVLAATAYSGTASRAGHPQDPLGGEQVGTLSLTVASSRPVAIIVAIPWRRQRVSSITADLPVP